MIATALLATALVVGWRRFLLGLCQKRAPFFEDVGAYFVPLWTAAARAMRSGHWPTHLLETWSGQPLLGDPQLGVFYPLHWLWLVIDPLRLYPISIVAHAVIAALGVVALSRERGRSWVAATTAAIATALGAFVVLEARHEMFVASFAWVPWLLWAIARHARRGDRRWAIAGSFALSLLAGGWSMLVFAAPVVIVFALARRARLAGVAAGLALGAGLAAIQLLPAIAHARLSPRALPLTDSFAGSYAWPSLRYAATLLCPLLYGDDARGHYHGAPDQWELSGYGVGALAAVLIALAFYRRRGRGERIAYLALLALATLLALGPHGPLWPLQRALPLVGRARCPARMLFVYTCFAPLLVADGVDALRARFRLRAAAWLVPIAVALELVLTFSAQNPTVPIADTEPAPEVLASLPRAPTPDGRTLVDVHLGQVFHNAPARWGIESPGGYSSLPLWRYLHLLWIANHGRTYPGWPRPSLASDLSAQGLWTLGSPIVDLLNVRWAMVPHARPPDAHGWRLLRAGRDGVDLYANDEALPRAFTTTRLRLVGSEDEAASALARPGLDPREAVVEQAVDVGAAPFFSPARIRHRRGDELVLDAGGPTAALLVLAEPYEPSWQARIDGREARVLRVDYALMGVRLPPGPHRVIFRRVDRPLRWGVLVSALALLLVFASEWRRRRYAQYAR